MTSPYPTRRALRQSRDAGSTAVADESAGGGAAQRVVPKTPRAGRNLPAAIAVGLDAGRARRRLADRGQGGVPRHRGHRRVRRRLGAAHVAGAGQHPRPARPEPRRHGEHARVCLLGRRPGARGHARPDLRRRAPVAGGRRGARRGARHRRAGCSSPLYPSFLAGFCALLLAAPDGKARVFVFILVTVLSDIGGYVVRRAVRDVTRWRRRSAPRSRGRASPARRWPAWPVPPSPSTSLLDGPWWGGAGHGGCGGRGRHGRRPHRVDDQARPRHQGHEHTSCRGTAGSWTGSTR